MKNKIKLAMTTAYLSHWQLPRQLSRNRHCLLFIAMSSCHDNQPPHLSLADREHPALLWFLSFASDNSPSLFFYHHPPLSLILFFLNWICDPLKCSYYCWTEWLSHQFPWAAMMWPWHRWEWQVWDEHSLCNILGLSGETNPVFACFPLFFFLFAKLGWYPTLITA